MEQFICKTQIVLGAGAVNFLKQWNIKKLFLVCDPYFYKNGMAQQVVCETECSEYQIFSDISPDPSVELAARGAAAVKAFAPDVIIALGGGSAMDAAKAMRYFSGEGAKLVMIPTTSGSGSEVTNFTILSHGGIKHPLVDEKILPDLAIVDSAFVEALPPSLIADGGFDLISHAMEAYVATNRSIFSDLFAQQAFRDAINGLYASYSGQLDSRGQIHTAATMAGIAFSQAGLGICHATSHCLGGEFHIPHGRLNAILLPAVVEANAAFCGTRYAQLARAAGLSGGSDVMAIRALKNALHRLRKNLGLPESLSQAGISPATVQAKMDMLVSASLADPCCETNPVKPTAHMVRQIITEVMGRG